MKIRKSSAFGEEKIELQMTPMIDIVFQLLVFFIMTFKIVSQEGDFNIKMPQSQRQGLPDPNVTPPLVVRLAADSAGNLAQISLNETNYESWDRLQNKIISLVEGDPGVRENTEVELDCDYNLHYVHVIDAITAVSGRIERPSGNIIKLVEKIKFSQLKKPQEG